MDEAEAQLSNKLLAMVGGSRPVVSPAQVQEHLQRRFDLHGDAVQVYRNFLDDFIMVFRDEADLLRVLHAEPTVNRGFSLFFRCWTRQARARFSPLYFKVLLSVTNIPAHAWSLDTAQAIMGSSCLIAEVSSRSLNGEDLSRFMVITWSLHPDLIPAEVGCIIPEPEQTFVEREPSLFLSASETIHSKKDTL
jgi:hypothetical protein